MIVNVMVVADMQEKNFKTFKKSAQCISLYLVFEKNTVRIEIKLITNEFEFTQSRRNSVFDYVLLKL